MENSTNTQELNMELVSAEIAGLSPDTHRFLNENFSTFMIATDGSIVNRPPQAGARRSVVRPTESDRLVMDTLIGLEVANAGILRQRTGLDQKTVSSALKYLIACTFVQCEGNGPSRTYQAATQNPVYPEHKQTTSRRSGHQTGPTARAAFITALNEVEPGSQFTLSDIQDRAIELFPASSFRKTSFGAIPSQLVEGGYIMGEGSGRSRVFTMGTSIIPGGYEAPTVTQVTETTDTNALTEEDQSALAVGLGD